MKILSLYAGYLNLRIITSIEDARVKFSGRDRIDNVIGALNDNLKEPTVSKSYAAVCPRPITTSCSTWRRSERA